MRTMNLHTRVTVYCRGKEYGILRKVVVDPDDGHITDLVVEPQAHAASIRVVPVSLVTYVDVNQVHLGLSAAQIDRYPAYPWRPDAPAGQNPLASGSGTGEAPQRSAGAPRLPESLHLPSLLGHVAGTSGEERGEVRAGEVNSPVECPAELVHERTQGSHAVEVPPGTPVLCGDGKLATVERAIVDPETRQLTHLTLRNRRVPGYRVIPVSGTKPGCNGLLLAPAPWDQLPLYEPREDREIREDILAYLQNQGGRPDRLDVRVDGGLVTLLGTLKGEALLARVVDLVKGIPGVIALRTEVDFLS